MKLKVLISGLVFTALSFLLFKEAWVLLETIADNNGREYRGGVNFILTVKASRTIITTLCGIIAIALSLPLNRKIQLIIPIVLLISWLAIVIFPSLDYYPYRGATLGLLGTVLLISQLGLLEIIKRANQSMEPTSANAQSDVPED